MAMAAVMLAACGDGTERVDPPQLPGCDVEDFAGWWYLGGGFDSGFDSCLPFASMTRLDGGPRPGGDCSVLSVDWAGLCSLRVEEVCRFATGYVHTVFVAEEPVDGVARVTCLVEMYSLYHQPVCFGSFDVEAVRVEVVGL